LQVAAVAREPEVACCALERSEAIFIATRTPGS
jgi:hypothetical protein